MLTKNIYFTEKKLHVCCVNVNYNIHQIHCKTILNVYLEKKMKKNQVKKTTF